MEEEQFFKEKPDSNIFKQIIYKYLPFWPLFVITTTVSLAFAMIDLRSQVPIFVASARVLLKDPQKGGGDSKVLDAMNIFSEKKIVDNEIVVLRSADIMTEVVKDLDLYATVYNKGNVRIEELYGDNSPVRFVALNKDNFNLWNTYYFSVNWKKKVLEIDQKEVPFNDTVVLGNATVRVIANDNYNQNVVGKNYFVRFASPGGVAG